MIFMLALLPATALTIGGYFVLYLSARSEGSLRIFGRYLGFWAFALAGLVVLGALFAAASRPRFMMHDGPGYMMHGGPGFDERGFFMRRFDREAPPPADTQAAPPAAPTTPAAPAPNGP